MKTKKLKCIITGKILNASIEYYNKKLEKAGSEEKLQNTYICKEARDLLLKGVTVEQARRALEVEDYTIPVDNTIIEDLLKDDYGIKRTNAFTVTGFTHQETDKEVKDFLNNI